MIFLGLVFLPFLPIGINYQTEVEPWIGDWAGLGLFVPQPAADGMFADLWDSAVMVLPVREQAGATNFVSKVREIQTQKPIERVYKGVQIIEWEEKEVPLEEYPDPMPPTEEKPQAFAPISRFFPHFFSFTSNQNQRKISQENSPNPAEPAPATEPAMPTDPESEETFPDVDLTVTQPGYAIALLPGYVVTANKADVLEKLIDSQAGISSVANDKSFQRTLNHPNFPNSVMLAYSNVKEAVKMVPVMPSKSLPSWLQLPANQISPEKMPGEKFSKQEKPEELPPQRRFPRKNYPQRSYPQKNYPQRNFLLNRFHLLANFLMNLLYSLAKIMTVLMVLVG